MKNILKQQKGMSFTGVLIILSLLGCLFLFGLRAFPIYNEYFSVKQSMKSVANQPFESRKNLVLIRRLLLRNLDINQVYRFNQKNIKEVAKVKKKNDKKYLVVKYDASKRLFSNLYLTIKVDESVELPGSKSK